MAVAVAEANEHAEDVGAEGLDRAPDHLWAVGSPSRTLRLLSRRDRRAATRIRLGTTARETDQDEHGAVAPGQGGMTPREPPPDFHALYDTGARRARGTTLSATEQQTPAATGRLAPDPDDLQVDVDEATGLPNLVTGLSPTARLSDGSSGSAEEAVGRFVAEHGDLWRLSPQDAQGVEITSISGSRLRTAHLVQRVDGVGSPGGPSPGSPSPSATASTLPSPSRPPRSTSPGRRPNATDPSGRRRSLRASNSWVENPVVRLAG